MFCYIIHFIVKTTIKSTDEWLHSFYYFNEEIPSESEFEKSIADFIAFKLDMTIHNKGYLFEDSDKNE